MILRYFSPVGRAVAVTFAALLVGPFQVYQLLILNYLWEPMLAWLRSIRPHSQPTSAFQQLLLIASALHIGFVIGAAVLFALRRHVNRKWTLVFAALLELCSGGLFIVGFRLQSVAVLVFARFMIGVCFVIGSVASALLAAEIAPTRCRGAYLSAQAYPLCVCSCLSLIWAQSSVIAMNLWHYAMAVGTVPAVVALLIIPFAAESPRRLYLTVGREDMSRQALVFYHGAAKVPTLLDELRRELPLQERASLSGRLFFNTVLLGVSRSTTGALLSVVCATNILQHFTPSARWATATTVAITLVGSLLGLQSPCLVNRCGQRQCLLSTSIIHGCFAYGGLALLSLWDKTTAWGFPTAVLLICVAMVSALIQSAGVETALGELYPQRLRLKGQCIGKTIDHLTSALLIGAFPALSTSVGIGWILMPFAASGLLVAWLSWRKLPETRLRTFAEIYQRYFERQQERAPLLGDNSGSPVQPFYERIEIY